MGCCRKGATRERPGPRTVICRKYVLPLRLVTVISIWIDVLYVVLHWNSLPSIFSLLMGIHVVLAGCILLECRRSEKYHALLERYSE